MSARQTRYGNWVSRKIVTMAAVPALFFTGLSFVTPWVLIGAIPLLLASSYFAYARYAFSPEGGNVQGRIQDLVLEHAAWDGQGRALDVGCGAGYMAIELARRSPDAQVTGIDCWGGMWESSHEVCEANAREAGVAGRVTFQRANAARLPFEDDTFDLVVSNMVFHEVKDASDKTQVVKEALRVLREGGRFAFQDTQFYGSIDDLLRNLREAGISEVQFVDTGKSLFIPVLLRLPLMVGTISMICGVK